MTLDAVNHYYNSRCDELLRLLDKAVRRRDSLAIDAYSSRLTELVRFHRGNFLDRGAAAISDYVANRTAELLDAFDAHSFDNYLDMDLLSRLGELAYLTRLGVRISRCDDDKHDAGIMLL